MWWDQNEEYSQFTGDHAFLYKGYSLLTDALAEGLDIQLSEEVCRKVEICVTPYINVTPILHQLLHLTPI
jgi:hypothetical protein